MVKVILCALFALCLVVDIYCLKLDQCPPGYRCRRKIAAHRFIRSIDSQVEEELEAEICRPGTFSPNGATECTPCETGTFAAHPGAPGCYDCPRGHICPQKDMEPEQCPLGTYNNLTRQTCCHSCPPGKFALLKGMSECQNCPSGYKCVAKAKLACEENG
jgi:hypothetical protein